MDVGDLAEAPVRVPVSYHPGRGAVSELLGGELPDGLEHPETSAERGGLDREHRPLDQILQQVVDIG